MPAVKTSTRHKWSPAWDEEENACIDKCTVCGLKRRKRICYLKGEMMSRGTVTEIMDGKTWRPQTETDICTKKSINNE